MAGRRNVAELRGSGRRIMTVPDALQAIVVSRVSGRRITTAAAVVQAVVAPLAAVPHFTTVPGKLWDEVIDASDRSRVGDGFHSVARIGTALMVFQFVLRIAQIQW